MTNHKVLVNKHKSISLQNEFKFGNEIITNSLQIGENFNDFFINIGPNLSKDEKIPESIFLNSFDENEVEAMINNLKEHI